MLTSIVIATFNKLEYTRQCIQSIRDYTEAGTYEIIVVDNHSTDETVDWLQQQTDIKAVFNKENLGFPKACNQGIGVAIGDNILLLNNDTIVTAGWLDNLTACLYSSDEFGAVGAITNNCSYVQTIPVSYSTIAEMQEFAKEHNRPNQAVWEERLKLIGFCMLIKKSVVDQIGLLDERFTPGNYEDDDYSLRIRLAGYRLILCKDTFIHHYGSVSFKDAPPEYIRLMQNNSQKFADKWGFNVEVVFKFRNDMASIIRKSKDASFRVLEVGCGMGGNLLQIRNLYPNADLYATESNPEVAHIARNVAAVQHGDLLRTIEMQPKNYYDCILVSESVASWESPVENLDKLQSLLNQNGELITFVPNALHHSKLQQLLRGAIKVSQLDGLVLQEAQEMFQQAGFNDVEFTGLVSPVVETDKAFLQGLAHISNIGETTPYEIAEFLIRAKNATYDSGDQGIKDIINHILTQSELKRNIAELAKRDVDSVCAVIADSNHEQREELLNYLAIQLLENSESQLSLQYLQQAFEWNPGNSQTLFNLGLTMYTQGHLELALEWFELLPEKNEQVKSWINEIRVLLNRDKKNHRLKFLLRRIEQGLNSEESLEELLNLLHSQTITENEIVVEVRATIIYKAELLTTVAVACFDRKMNDYIFGLLEAALLFEPSNSFALFQLASILHEFGEDENALIYLDRMEKHDQQAEDLISQIRGQHA